MDYTFFIYIKSSSVACTNMVTLYNKVSFVNMYDLNVKHVEIMGQTVYSIDLKHDNFIHKYGTID